MDPPSPQHRGHAYNQYGQGQFRGGQPILGRQGGVRREFHQYCGRWHTPRQCWSEGESSGCSNCGGNHLSDECHQPDKVIRLPHPVANPYQQVRENMREERGQQGGHPNELRPPNLYYDYINARQTFHPPAGLQMAI